MPKGVYERKQQKAVEVKQDTPEQVKNMTVALDVGNKIQTIAKAIRVAHGRIASTALDIGSRFFEIKVLIEGVPSDVRRAQNIPTFTGWMDGEAPKLCNMSGRTAWRYLQDYTEAQAAGLSKETIIALAPGLLKSEKPRQVVLHALRRKPEIVAKLNEASSRPKLLKAIAHSPTIRKWVKNLVQATPEKQAANRSERLTRLIIQAYRPVFKAEKLNADECNKALGELEFAMKSAARELGIENHLIVGVSRITPKDVQAATDKLTAAAKPPVNDLLDKLGESITDAIKNMRTPAPARAQAAAA